MYNTYKKEIKTKSDDSFKPSKMYKNNNYKSSLSADTWQSKSLCEHNLFH